MEVISVLIVDANPAFLRIATRLLREHYQQHLQVVGTSHGEQDAIQQAQALQPCVVLLGIGQLSLKGLHLIPRLRAASPRVRIIVLGSLDISAYHQAAMEAGADAFVAKVAINSLLLPTIRRVRGLPPENGQNPEDNLENSVGI
jgi:DNA-binding NarL/FixJ family response regulator